MRDHSEIRRRASLILHHVTKAEGLREALADDAGEMAEAKRNLIRLVCGHDLGCGVPRHSPGAR